MPTNERTLVRTEETTIRSRFLHRDVKIDFFIPPDNEADPYAALLLINDGQDMATMGFDRILDDLYHNGAIRPLLCCAIHAGTERRMEYGTQLYPDYKNRGNKAAAYTAFILEELIPLARKSYNRGQSFGEYAYAGFSLGGLSALDIAWNRPDIFSKAGVFSASLWWRSLDQEDPLYDDDKHRIMHQQIRNGSATPGLRFFFQCGALDEMKDRNQNGVIDSIDDTLDLIHELEAKGYKRGRDIIYLELPEGRHDVPTWGLAMPLFLQWGWPAGA